MGDLTELRKICVAIVESRQGGESVADDLLWTRFRAALSPDRMIQIIDRLIEAEKVGRQLRNELAGWSVEALAEVGGVTNARVLKLREAELLAWLAAHPAPDRGDDNG